jgi:hypothetical protein
MLTMIQIVKNNAKETIEKIHAQKNSLIALF